MGLFSWLSKKDKGDEGQARRSGATPSPEAKAAPKQPTHEMNLTERIEQCYQFNARCLGAIAVCAQFHEAFGDYPKEFCDLITQTSSELSGQLEMLLSTEGGKGASRVIPSDFAQVCRYQPSNDPSQYVSDMGNYAFIKPTGGKRGFSIDSAIMCRTSEVAIAECLSLLRLATEEGAGDVAPLLLGDSGYLTGLARLYTLMQLRLMLIARPNSMIFIPDSYLSSDNLLDRTVLRFHEFDACNPPERTPIPIQLVLLLRENNDGSMVPGRIEDGKAPGTLYRADDPQVPRCLDAMVRGFVGGIVYDIDGEPLCPLTEAAAELGQAESRVNLTEYVEQCLYWNARCIGNCVFIGLINDRDKWYPEQFCDFLFNSAGLLSEDLAKLLETEGGRGARWLYPDDFEQVFQQGQSQDYQQYIVDVGKYAFFKEAGSIGAYDRYPGTYLRTTDIAINKCLTLLRVASEENAEDILNLMLADGGYMMGLASHYLLIQLFLRRMHRTEDFVFIPDKYLDSDDGSNRVMLRVYDQEVDDSSRIVYVPEQLHPMWIQSDSGPIATGHLEFMGTMGTILKVTDQQVPKYFDTIVKNFVKGIAY